MFAVKIIKRRYIAMKVIINKDKCPQNHKCPSIKVCPKNAITQKDSQSLPQINYDLCILCGKCMKFCPKGAFEMQ